MPFKAENIENLHKAILEEEPDYLNEGLNKISINLLKQMLKKKGHERISI